MSGPVKMQPSAVMMSASVVPSTVVRLMSSVPGGTLPGPVRTPGWHVIAALPSPSTIVSPTLSRTPGPTSTGPKMLNVADAVPPWIRSAAPSADEIAVCSILSSPVPS